MKKIAHRGNVYGPNPILENQPQHLLNAIKMGYDVEVDTWLINDVLYLGHSEPIHKIDLSFLIDISDKAWFHCKNLEALCMFSKTLKFCNFFWHQEDRYTLTSKGYIWTYPGNTTSEFSVLVDLDLTSSIDQYSLYGLCSDYVGLIDNNIISINSNRHL
jgi:hypothetical protein